MQLKLAPIRAAFALLNFTSARSSAKLAQRLYTVPSRKTKTPTSEERAFFTNATAFSIPYPSHPLRAWRLGDSDAKPVLLVHGWNGNPSAFVPLANRLLALGFQVICYEAPGHGLHPEHFTTPMGFADSIHAALNTIGPVHAIVGHSMAAGALVMASKRGLPTERLILLSPWTRVIDHTHLFGDYMGISRNAIALMRKLVWDYGEPSSSRYGSDWDSLYTTPQEHPTLIIHDEKDPMVPVANAEWLKQQWPQSCFVKTKGLRHNHIMKDPDVMGQICRFLAEATPSGATIFSDGGHEASFIRQVPVPPTLRPV
ncbi:MAG: hypothetical protein A3I66_12565 [Burkholderiales bacterium RIFCSPLOWO2_02_FULL_57_36]|nr:MAG: hypothetical protein A3I66_12565 [Burkholderiales bacterium RIFCSPLOWO2_02_FULL_57_36]